MDKHQIALRLRQWQDTIGLTAPEICQIIAVPENTWYRYRTGKHLPQPQYLIKLAQILGLDIHWLYTGDSRPATNHAARPIQPLPMDDPFGNIQDLWAR